MAVHDIYSGREDRLPARQRRSAPAARPAPVTAPGFLSVLWRRKLVVLGSLLACLAAGAAYIVITPSRYLATAAMLIDPRLGKSVGTDPNTPGFIADSAAIDSQIKLFTSQTVLARVAKQADLAADPEFNGSQRSLLQRLLHPSQVANDAADLRTLEEAITIKRPERTYVVEIDVLARDPNKAALIANDLTGAYIEDQVSSRIDAARDDSQYVSQKLDKLSAQIKDLDTKIEDYKVKNKIIETTGLRTNEQQVTDLTRSLGDARTKLSDAKAKLAEVDRLGREGRLDSVSDALKSITIERLRQQQAEAESNAARLAKTLGDRHPEMVEVRERQVAVRALIRAELQRLQAGAQADYQAARSHEAQIAAEVDTLKGQSSKLSQALVPLDQLERNRTVLRSSFERFSQVNSSLAQQEAGSPPGRVIAVARPPVSPSAPKKTVVGLVALSAGLFFGLAGALFAESTGAPLARVPGAPSGEPDQPPRLQRARRYWDDDDEWHA